jgi:hypothetical protein
MAINTKTNGGLPYPITPIEYPTLDQPTNEFLQDKVEDYNEQGSIFTDSQEAVLQAARDKYYLEMYGSTERELIEIVNTLHRQLTTKF